MPYDSVVRALYAYEATAEDELTFAEDEILCILPNEGERDDSWLLARPLQSENPELSGLIPANYVAPLEGNVVCEAIYDYEAQEDNELSFREGETLILLTQLEDDWWLVKNCLGVLGLIPSNYVQTANSTCNGAVDVHEIAAAEGNIFEATPIPVAKGTLKILFPASKTKKKWPCVFQLAPGQTVKGKLLLLDGDVLVFTHGREKTVEFHHKVSSFSGFDVRVGYLSKADGSEPYLLTLMRKSDSTELARLIEKKGSKTVIIQPTQVDSPPIKSIVEEPAEIPTATAGYPVRVLYDYEAQQKDELDILEGDEVIVLDDSSPDWWLVVKSDGSAQGVVPKSYLATEEAKLGEHIEHGVDEYVGHEANEHFGYENGIDEHSSHEINEQEGTERLSHEHTEHNFDEHSKYKIDEHAEHEIDEHEIAAHEIDEHEIDKHEIDKGDWNNLSYETEELAENPETLNPTYESEPTGEEDSSGIIEEERPQEHRLPFLGELLKKSQRSMEMIKEMDSSRKESLKDERNAINESTMKGPAIKDTVAEELGPTVGAGFAPPPPPPSLPGRNSDNREKKPDLTTRPSLVPPPPPPPPPPLPPRNSANSTPIPLVASHSAPPLPGRPVSLELKEAPPPPPPLPTRPSDLTTQETLPKDGDSMHPPEPLSASTKKSERIVTPSSTKLHASKRASLPDAGYLRREDGMVAAKSENLSKARSNLKSPSLGMTPKALGSHEKSAVTVTKQNPWATVSLKKTDAARATPPSSTLSNMSSLSKALPDRPSKPISASKPTPTETRLWKDKSGKFQVEAAFVSFERGVVTIHKLNGTKVNVPIDLLGERDVEYVYRRCGLDPASFKRASMAMGNSRGNALPPVGDHFKVNGFDWLEFLIGCGVDSSESARLARQCVQHRCDQNWLEGVSRDRVREKLVGIGESDCLLFMQGVTKRKLKRLEALGQERLLHSLSTADKKATLPSQEKAPMSPAAVPVTSLGSQLAAPLMPKSTRSVSSPVAGPSAQMASLQPTVVARSIKNVPALQPQNSVASVKMPSQPIFKEFSSSGLVPMPDGSFAQQQTTTQYMVKRASSLGPSLLTSSHHPASIPATNNFYPHPPPIKPSMGPHGMPNYAGQGALPLAMNVTSPQLGMPAAVPQPNIPGGMSSIQGGMPSMGPQQMAINPTNHFMGYMNRTNMQPMPMMMPFQQPSNSFRPQAALSYPQQQAPASGGDKYSIFKQVDPRGASSMFTRPPYGS